MTTQPTSNEIINAASVPSSITAVEHTSITNQQVRDIILGFLAQKDYTLPKHFERGYALAAPVTSFEEAIKSIQSSIRAHLIDRASKNEASYAQQVVVINKIFSNIENLMDLLVVNGVTTERNEMLVFILGNMLKCII